MEILDVGANENRWSRDIFASYTSISYKLGQRNWRVILTDSLNSINSFIEVTHKLIMYKMQKFVVEISQMELSSSSIISTNTEVTQKHLGCAEFNHRRRIRQT